MELTLKIEPIDSTEGIQSSCSQCPAARALERYGSAPYVTTDFVQLHIDGQDYEAKTPPKLAKFIRDFDAAILPRTIPPNAVAVGNPPPKPISVKLRFTPILPMVVADDGTVLPATAFKCDYAPVCTNANPH
jgi:hypothetical protein